MMNWLSALRQKWQTWQTGSLKWLIRGALAVGSVVAVLAGILYLGEATREDLKEKDRYTIAFQEIDCHSPSGMDRIDFLDEVQFFGSMPRELNLLDEQLPEKLAEAFRLHPWVDEVQQIRVVPLEGIQVQVKYRRPVLAVKWKGTRAVDAHGRLLPKNAPTKGLPFFSGKPSPPQGPPGKLWGDPAIHKAAQQAAPKMLSANKN